MSYDTSYSNLAKGASSWGGSCHGMTGWRIGFQDEIRKKFRSSAKVLVESHEIPLFATLYGPLAVNYTYNPIYGMYHPIFLSIYGL